MSLARSVQSREKLCFEVEGGRSSSRYGVKKCGESGLKGKLLELGGS